MSDGSLKWIDLDAPAGKTIRAAIAWPEGPGPFPVIVILHGTGGFEQRFVELAQDFATHGYIGIAGCWFEGNHLRQGRGGSQEQIDCPEGPEYRGVTPGSVRNAVTLLNAAKSIEDADLQRIGLWGQSRGASMSLVLGSTGANITAVVAAAAAYTELPGGRETPPMTYVQDLAVPVLMLHGTSDEIISVRQAEEYEDALAVLGKPYEVHYFDGAPHFFALLPRTKEEAFRLAVEFFDQTMNQRQE